LNLQQLEYIAAVAKVKSMAIAAENLCVSQSGISRAINNFEEELNLKIFNRSKLGTTLTDDGIEIVKIIHNILLKIDNIRDISNIKNSSIKGELKISATPSVLMAIIIKAIPIFKSEYPNIKLEVSENNSDKVIRDVLNQKIDMGFTHLSNEVMNLNNLDYGTFIDGKMCVCVNKHSHLAANSSLSPNDILNQPLVMYNGPNMKYFLEHLVNKYGKMEVFFWANNMDVVKKSVIEGLAITFTIDLALQDDLYVKNGDLILIPLTNFNITTIPFGWIKLKNRSFTYKESEFINYVHKTME